MISDSCINVWIGHDFQYYLHVLDILYICSSVDKLCHVDVPATVLYMYIPFNLAFRRRTSISHVPIYKYIYMYIHTYCLYDFYLSIFEYIHIPLETLYIHLDV